MLSERILHQTSQQVSDLLGLHFPKSRWSDLSRGLIAAAKDLGLGNNLEYINIWFDGRTFTPDELDILTNHLTVGETYFFRDKTVLDAFQNNIIPALLAERFGKNQRINIWSAGCCTGEEPYSLAILLLETVPDIQHWQINILATDLNRTFLQKAAKGIYGNWSFRETPEKLRDRYFTKVKTHWQIAPEVQKMVHFKQLNLAEDSYPSAQSETSYQDIIFCRNVLMYFSNDLIQSIGIKFYEALNPNGWLITTAVEVNDEFFSTFARIQVENSILYQKSEKKVRIYNRWPEPNPDNKTGKKEPVKQKPHIKNPVLHKHIYEHQKKETQHIKKPLDEANTYFKKGLYQMCADLCSREISFNVDKIPWLVLLVQAYANLGKHEDALSWGAQLLKLDSLNVENYYMLASIYAADKAFADAESLLKRGLYLDQTHILSQLLLGNVYLRLGNQMVAARHFSNVRKLLAPLDENILLEGSDGLTVGSILEMVTALT